MMIWRSLYENAIVLLTLAFENDNDLARKYNLHSARNARKKVQSYNSHHKELKFRPLPASTKKNLQTNLENAKSKYGKDFLDNEYGWADGLFPGKQKASLRLHEERAEMSRFRPYYLLCSEHTHPGFTSFKDYMEGNKIIFAKAHKTEF